MKKKSKTTRKPVTPAKLKQSSADWYALPTAGKTFTFDGKVYSVITCEQITEYDSSNNYQPTFRKVFLKGIRKVDAKEAI